MRRSINNVLSLLILGEKTKFISNSFEEDKREESNIRVGNSKTEG